MTGLEPFIRGVIAGLAIAIPVGPVNVLCVSRTLAKGWKSGLISGLGAAAADTLYGAVAGFSISIVIGFLLRELFWIRLIGGILLVFIGAAYYFKRPKSLKEERKEGTETSDLASTFLLTLANPSTVLSFLALLAALGMSHHKNVWLTLLLVGGIFSGSMLWWIVLTGVVNKLRDKFTDTSLLWMNRIAGIAIAAFGLLTALLSRGHHR